MCDEHARRRVTPTTAMTRRPLLRPDLRVEVIGEDAVLLLSEAGHAHLDGRVFARLVPLLDGCRDEEDVVASLSPEFPAETVLSALALLERRGYLTGDPVSAGDAAFWAVRGVAPSIAARRLAATPVSVEAVGAVAVDVFVQSLAALGVRTGSEGTLAVVLVDDYLRHAVATVNEAALRSLRPWLLVKPVGAEIWIGPLFRPGQTACWACLALRLRLHRPLETFVQHARALAEPARPPPASVPAIEQAACGMAASRIATWIARDETTRLGCEVLSVNTLDWQSRRHALMPQPACPACGGEALRRRAPRGPLHLRRLAGAHRSEGRQRAPTLDETLRRLGHHVSPITGVVSTLHRRVEDTNDLLHVYAAEHGLLPCYRSLRDLERSLSAACSGSGRTDAEARAACLCEALERYSGVLQGNEPRRRARLADLDGRGIHPNACMLFSERQYRERDAINVAGHPCHTVPLPFDETALLDWTPVWSLTREEVRYLPTEYCYYARPDPDRWYWVACSNGNAAGHNLAQAALQGLLELVERDATALWWYVGARLRALDLDTFDDPYLARLRELLAARGHDLWVLDLTTDVGIPVLVALSRRSDDEAQRVFLGFGAHLDVHAALRHAVAELTKSLVPVLSERRLGRKGVTAATLERPAGGTSAARPHLEPAAGRPPRAACDYPRIVTGDVLEDLELCRARVECLGMEVLVLDQTRPEIGLPVVRVMVPGLRHHWPRFAPGRLYEVPVKLGWRDAPPDEADLEPVPPCT